MWLRARRVVWILHTTAQHDFQILAITGIISFHFDYIITWIGRIQPVDISLSGNISFVPIRNIIHRNVVDGRHRRQFHRAPVHWRQFHHARVFLLFTCVSMQTKKRCSMWNCRGRGWGGGTNWARNRAMWNKSFPLRAVVSDDGILNSNRKWTLFFKAHQVACISPLSPSVTQFSKKRLEMS